MTSSHALFLSWSHGARVSDIIYMDISAFGSVLSTGFSAIHLLERRHSAVMEKYASLRKKQFPAITVALLYLVNLNKRGGYLYLSNLINWKNFEDFSIQTVPFVVPRETVHYALRNGVRKGINSCYFYRILIDFSLPTSSSAVCLLLQP